MKKISTQPYKGVRDFYPEDWRFQKWLFWQMASAAELFGYENYTASPLEYSELYIAKSGKEIVENETYNLIDRGGREITLRPEMTPTVARMIAARGKELTRPIRWYSIPNLFRYEKMQRGRLREHYQFNADIFGVEGIEAEIELIEMGAKVLENMGLKQSDFEIKINNRKIWQSIFAKFNLTETESYELSKLIDKKNKIKKDIFIYGVQKILKEKSEEFLQILKKDKITDFADLVDKKIIERGQKLISSLQEKGLKNVIFDITLMRGFDYYTDIVFEFFDTNPQNNRSMFGGGRYDDLLDIFGQEKIPAVGFGMGDVTARDSLAIRNLIPKLKPKTKLVAIPNSDLIEKIINFLRENNINIAVDYSSKKLNKKINTFFKKDIPALLYADENTKKIILIYFIEGEKKEEFFSADEVTEILNILKNI